MKKNLDHIAEGGSAFRLLIGEYGSGKTFFMNLVRGAAMERQLVVAHADLNPSRRLQASGGEARSLYAELMKNLATRTRPEGGALQTVVEKFITTALAEARKAGSKPEDIIHERLGNLSELVMGYDFATVIAAYWRAYETGDDALKDNAIRWLHGEFSAKSDARRALGVREIIGDAALYDQLKLMAKFCRLAGNVRKGLDTVLATAPQLTKRERWTALVLYIVEKIIATKSKNFVQQALMPSKFSQPLIPAPG